MPQNTDPAVVLVAEDGDGTRQLTCLVLESFGYRCHGVSTVEAAMERIRTEPRIDVVFSDIHFPGALTGVDLALMAQQLPHRLPVLLTSGLAPEYVEQVLPEGVAFLDKPYTPPQLLRAIHALRRRRPGERTASAA